MGFACGGSGSGTSRLLQQRNAPAATTSRVAAAATSRAAAAAPVIDEELQLASLLAVTGLTSKEGGEKSAAIVHNILNNIVEHPDADKYRTLKLSNKAIQKYISGFPEASRLLQLVGFIEQDDAEDGGRRLRLPAKAPLSKLKQLVADIAKLVPVATKKTRPPASKNSAYDQRMDGVNQDQLQRQQERQRLLEQIKVSAMLLSQSHKFADRIASISKYYCCPCGETAFTAVDDALLTRCKQKQKKWVSRAYVCCCKHAQLDQKRKAASAAVSTSSKAVSEVVKHVVALVITPLLV